MELNVKVLEPVKELPSRNFEGKYDSVLSEVAKVKARGYWVPIQCTSPQVANSLTTIARSRRNFEAKQRGSISYLRLKDAN